MLRHVLGDAVFFDCIMEYATDQNFQYGLASTEDFRQVCEQISGLDLSAFFDQWIYDEYYPKYTYDYVQDGDYNTVLGILQTQGDNGWRDFFEMPVDVKFHFADGSDTTVVVQNDAVFQSFGFQFTKEVTSVTIDPDNWILKTAIWGDLDLSVEENSLSNDLLICPNPVQDRFRIENSSTAEIRAINIYDLLGRLIQAEKGNVSQVEVSQVNSGLLFVEIETDRGKVTKKIIKE